MLKYDVIHDVLKVDCNTNLSRSRNFGDIGKFGDMATGRNLAKIREIASIYFAGDIYTHDKCAIIT